MSQFMITILLSLTIITGLIRMLIFFQNKLYKKNYLNNKKYYSCYSNLYKYVSFVASLFPIFLIIFIVRCFFYEPFQIPSGSMIPNLLIGDFILVEKFSFGIKDPIFHKKLIDFNNKPNRGDVIVFRYPLNTNVLYIKRIIGLPGDNIVYNYKKKQLSIYSKCKNNLLCNNKILVTYQHDKNIVSSSYNKFKYILSKSGIVKINKFFLNPYSLSEKMFQETINSSSHKILLLNNIIDTKNLYFKQKSYLLGSWIVPKSKYFVMGDNRDNSYDSRYWGFVPEENIVGKAIIVWFSLKKEENKWPTGLRLNRIGWIQ